jgi:hypothetical protein
MKSFGVYNLHIIFLGDKPRDDEKEAHAAGMLDITITYKLVMGKPEGKRQLGKPRGRWENNIKVNTK